MSDMDTTIRIRAEDEASKTLERLTQEANQLKKALGEIAKAPKIAPVDEALVSRVRAVKGEFKEINKSLTGTLKEMGRAGRFSSDRWNEAEEQLDKLESKTGKFSKNQATQAAARIRETNAYRAAHRDLVDELAGGEEKVSAAQRKSEDARVKGRQFWRKFDQDIFNLGLKDIRKREQVRQAAEDREVADRVKTNRALNRLDGDIAKAAASNGRARQQVREKEASDQIKTNVALSRLEDNIGRAALANVRARHAERERAELAHAAQLGRIRSAGGGVYNSARKTVRSFSHPFFHSPVFYAGAGAALAEREGHKAIEKAEELDRAETEARFRFLGQGRDAMGAGRDARSLRDWSMGRSVALGAPAHELLAGSAEATAHGIPEGLSNSFTELMFNTSKVFGEKLEHVSENIGYALAQQFHGPWHGEKNMDRANDLVGSIARLSTSGIGTNADRMMAFAQSGIGAGQGLGLNTSTTLGMGAALTSAGLTGPMASRMLQLSGEHLSDLAIEERDKRRQHFSFERDRWLSVPRNLGYGSYEHMSRDMKANPNEAFPQLFQRFGNIKDINERNYAIAQVVGPQYARAINNLINNPEILKKAMETAQKGGNGDFLKSLEAEYQKGLEYKIDQIRETVNNVFAEVGDVMKDDIIEPLRAYVVDWSQYTGDIKAKFRGLLQGLLKGLGYSSFAEMLTKMFGVPQASTLADIRWWTTLGQNFTEGLRASIAPFVTMLEFFVGKLDAQKIAWLAGGFLGLTAAMAALSPLTGVMGVIFGTGGTIWGLVKFMKEIAAWRMLAETRALSAAGVSAGTVAEAGLVGALLKNTLKVTVIGAVAIEGWDLVRRLLEWFQGKGNDLTKTIDPATGSPYEQSPMSIEPGKEGWLRRWWNGTGEYAPTGFGGGAGGGSGGLGIHGAALRGRGRGGGSGGIGGGGGTGPAIPDNVPMTAEERNKLGLIQKYESGGRNVPNYINDRTHTAQGFFQLTNTNWRKIAPQLGITAPTAMAATHEEQARVALHLLRHGGIQNWANYNPKLRAALARGEQLSSTGVPALGDKLASDLKLSGAQAVGGGNSYAGTQDVAKWAQASLPGFRAITALNDHYHQGTGSKHADGLAGDIGLERGTPKSVFAERAEQLRAQFQKAGLGANDFKVLDEANHPSARATGPHLHYQFESAEAAQKYHDFVSQSAANAVAVATGAKQAASIATGAAGAAVLTPLDVAGKYLGMHEKKDNAALKAFTGREVAGDANAWCTTFVNAALRDAGIKGTGSPLAASFKSWGQKVDMKDVQANDVLYRPKEKGGGLYGHTAIATGKTKMENGMLRVETVAGNHNDDVSYAWYPAEDFEAHRAIGAGDKIKQRNALRPDPRTGIVGGDQKPIQAALTVDPKTVAAAAQTPSPSEMAASVGNAAARMGDGAMMGGHHHHGDTHYHIHGADDPEATARAVNKTMAQQMNRRAHDVESDFG